MTLSETGKIERVNGGPYQRLYLPTGIIGDSAYPFRPRQHVRYELVSVGRTYVLVVVPRELKIDRDETSIVLERSGSDVQATIPDVVKEAERDGE